MTSLIWRGRAGRVVFPAGQRKGGSRCPERALARLWRRTRRPRRSSRPATTRTTTSTVGPASDRARSGNNHFGDQHRLTERQVDDDYRNPSGSLAAATRSTLQAGRVVEAPTHVEARRRDHHGHRALAHAEWRHSALDLTPRRCRRGLGRPVARPDGLGPAGLAARPNACHFPALSVPPQAGLGVGTLGLGLARRGMAIQGAGGPIQWPPARGIDTPPTVSWRRVRWAQLPAARSGGLAMVGLVAVWQPCGRARQRGAGPGPARQDRVRWRGASVPRHSVTPISLPHQCGPPGLQLAALAGRSRHGWSRCGTAGPQAGPGDAGQVPGSARQGKAFQGAGRTRFGWSATAYPTSFRPRWGRRPWTGRAVTRLGCPGHAGALARHGATRRG
jgi:hypothetical protein